MNNVPLDPWWTFEGPWVHHEGSGFDTGSVTLAAPADARIVLLHGEAMSDKQTLMREFVRAFGFPDYFGDNWSALEDCLQDLTWADPRQRYLLVIDDYGLVLDADPNARETLVEVLEEVGSIWSSVGHGDGPVAFNSVLVE